MTDITPTSVANAKTGDVLRDGTLPGLHLRVFENRKAYYLYYRTKAKRERRPKIGDFDVISLTQARSIARAMLGEVAAGKDPVEERRKEASAHTMAWLCETYIKEYGRFKKSGKNDAYIIKSCIAPAFHKRKINEIHIRDISKFHRKRSNTPYQANRALSLLSTMFNQAILWGERPQGSNPCDRIRRFPEVKRKRHMSSEEAVKINNALEHYKDRYPNAVLFIYLLILSGARKSEIAKATPDRIQGNRLVDMGDNKTGDDRPVYLPEPVMDLLKKIPASAKTITGIKDPRKVWAMVRERAGCPDLRIHDLRRSYASAALSLGYSLDQIGKLLRHKSTATTAGYAWLSEQAENTVAESTAQRIVDVMEGRATFNS